MAPGNWATAARKLFSSASTSTAMNLPKPLVPVLSPSEPNFALTAALVTSGEPPEESDCEGFAIGGQFGTIPLCLAGCSPRSASP